MKEIWKDIKGFEGRYRISNLGNFMSYTKKKWVLKKGTIGGRKGTQYKVHELWKDGKRVIGKKKSQLVAIAFIPNPNNLPQVNHIDGNTFNDRVDNLEWVSNRENSTHRNFITGTMKSKLVGACWDKSRNKWSSIIKINGKQKNLGRFNTPEQAHQAYKDALKLYGLTNKYVNGV